MDGGMLHQVRINTPNNSGVAARSPLVGQYGLNYNPEKYASRFTEDGASKKFKGALDGWLQKVAVSEVCMVFP